MKIATFNVNSVKARLPNLLAWLKSASPDVVLLQEIKCVDDAFPRMEIEELGYNIETHGQKSYNGVAIFSKIPISVERRGLPNLEPEDNLDEQARYIEALVGPVRVASIYLPNGNPLGTEKFLYKLRWMDRLIAHAQSLLEHEDMVVLGGDYNVIPEDFDCYDIKDMAGDALIQPESRGKFRAIQNLGYVEAFRTLHPKAREYSFWDYQKGRWQRDQGLRIDHFLLSPQAADKLKNCWIDKAPRGEEKASDHTPVWVDLTV